MQVETSKCPWCGNTIPQAKFVEIEGRIRTEEKRKLAQAEASFKKQYEEQARLQIERETMLSNGQKHKPQSFRPKEITHSKKRRLRRPRKLL